MDSEKVINLIVLAHVDAGKTTLTEQLLYLAGRVRHAGNVDTGTLRWTFCRLSARGISVRAATAVFTYKDVRVNLIDTPGHADSISEAERSLRAPDAAILVVSAAEGVQSQTETFWKALRALPLPTLIFVNKIDRIEADIPFRMRRGCVQRGGKRRNARHLYA